MYTIFNVQNERGGARARFAMASRLTISSCRPGTEVRPYDVHRSVCGSLFFECFVQYLVVESPHSFGARKEKERAIVLGEREREFRPVAAVRANWRVADELSRWKTLALRDNRVD